MPPVLLLVDFQEEWRDKKSDYYLGDFKPKLRNAGLLVDYFHRKKWPVIFTRHVEVGSTRAFAEGTKNAQIISDLKEMSDSSDIVLTKNKINPFYNTGLERILKEIKSDELVVAGTMTNLCVRSAVSDAYDGDYSITVVTDACVSESSQVDKFTFQDLKKTRPRVEFVKTKDFVSAT
jgi:nicotinamidase-related amidase